MSLSKSILHGKEHRAMIRWRQNRLDHDWYGPNIHGALRSMMRRYKDKKRRMRGEETR